MKNSNPQITQITQIGIERMELFACYFALLDLWNLCNLRINS